jgi:hypothetical protein
MMRAVGEMPEWPNGTDSKSVVPSPVPRVRIPISPPYLYVKALIIQGFFVSVFLKKIPAHTLAHTLDGSVFFRPKADFSTVSKRCSPGAIRRSI